MGVGVTLDAYWGERLRTGLRTDVPLPVATGDYLGAEKSAWLGVVGSVG